MLFDTSSMDSTGVDVTATAPTVPIIDSSAPDAIPYSDPTTTAADAGGSGGTMAGIASIFDSVGTAFSSIYRTVNPATPPRGTTAPPGYYWDQNTAQYRPLPGTSVGAVLGSNTGMLLVVGLVAVALLLVVSKKKVAA